MNKNMAWLSLFSIHVLQSDQRESGIYLEIIHMYGGGGDNDDDEWEERIMMHDDYAWEKDQ